MGAVEKRIEKLEHDRARSREGLFWALGIAYGAFFGWVIGRQKGAEQSSRDQRELEERQQRYSDRALLERTDAAVRALARLGGVEAEALEHAIAEQRYRDMTGSVDA